MCSVVGFVGVVDQTAGLLVQEGRDLIHIAITEKSLQEATTTDKHEMVWAWVLIGRLVLLVKGLHPSSGWIFGVELCHGVVPV